MANKDRYKLTAGEKAKMLNALGIMEEQDVNSAKEVQKQRNCEGYQTAYNLGEIIGDLIDDIVEIFIK